MFIVNIAQRKIYMWFNLLVLAVGSHEVSGVTAEYPATWSILRSWLRGTRKELKSRWRSIFTSWLRRTRYAEKIKFKMAKYL